MEYVAIAPAVFVTTTELIRVVVAAGVVYRVVLDVAAAPLKRTLNVLAIFLLKSQQG